jgi:putative transposase
LFFLRIQKQGSKEFEFKRKTCPNCGEHHDRDVNATKNILNEGMRILAAGLAV